MFGCQSLEIFWKKTDFLNSWNFCEKVQKKVGKFKFGKGSDINQNCTSISKISKKLHIVLSFLVKQSCFWVKKFGKSLVKVWKSLEKFGKNRKSSEIGFSKCSEILEILEIVLFRTFQKWWKNDVKLELQKSRKAHSDLKTDLKVRLKVQNAGPYC